jgi:LmbE family N-acetylglucosaminyl deacetylase
LTEKPRTALVVVPHADDVSFFCGGLVARWADEGWRVVLVRVTDDDKDSVGLDREETRERNARELRDAARILGVSECVDLDYVTDTLGDASLVEIRERLIRLIRTWRPYATLTFDPYGAFHEDNQDHVVVAKVVDEAFWTSMFDKHHPEHLAEGLEPHGVFERWYFARRLLEVTDAVDIASTIDRKVEAVLAHRTMVDHIVRQWSLQAATGGLELAALEAARDKPGPLVERLVRAEAARTGRKHDLVFAEEYRRASFSALAPVLS